MGEDVQDTYACVSEISSTGLSFGDKGVIRQNVVLVAFSLQVVASIGFRAAIGFDEEKAFRTILIAKGEQAIRP